MPALPMTKAAQMLPYLQAAMDEFEINTRLRVCAFVAQLGHESQDMTKWRENMNYSATRLRQVFKKYFPTMASAKAVEHQPAAIANIVYGGRMGNTRPGDGWKFIARGPIGATGREMYEAAGRALNLPLGAQPELVERLEIGLRVAAWIWACDKRCNSLADQLHGGKPDKQELATIIRITERINGGRNGLEDRVARYARARDVITGDSRSWPDERAPEPEEVNKWLSDGKDLSIPAQQSTPGASGDTKTETTTVNASQAQETSGNAEPAASENDFQKLLRNDAIKTSAKTNSVRGVKLLWRPVAALIAAIQAGNIFAISGTVLAVVVVIVVACLYYKEIRSGVSSLIHFIVDYFTK